MKEGSFEGQIPGLDFSSNLQTKTPDQLPERIDFSQIPENVLKSNVIESLISQNDDLMARLTVSLRRISLLEEKFSDAKNETNQYRSKYDNLRDQVLILKEQAKILAERNRETADKQKREDESTSELKSQIRLLEVRYAELYTSSRERQNKFEGELARSERATSRYRKYRQGIRRAIAFVREELRTLRAKRSLQDATIQDLRKNLQETTTYITEQNKNHRNELTDLTGSYETQIKDMRSEIEMLMEQNKMLGERGHELERLQGEKIRIENDLIIAERRFEDLQVQSTAEITDVQKTLARYRNDANELAVELEAKNKAFTEREENVAALTTERSALNEQVETLQLLWREQQVQVEKLTEQKNALQRLNQELSISINEQRRELREAKEQLEAEQLKLVETAKAAELKERIANAARASENKTGEKLKRTDKTPELLAKIDKALNHLHVGK
jgi:chromosome segregation ATPase